MKFIKQNNSPISTFLIHFSVSLMILFSCEEAEVIPIENDTITNIEEFQIETIFPKIADLGDTLTLKGKEFSGAVNLKMNKNLLKVIFSNDTIVKFQVPYSGFDPVNFKLIVFNEEEKDTLTNPFTLFTPTIDSISNNFGMKDKVVIYGKHLSNNPASNENIIKINEQEISVLGHNKDSVWFNLPHLTRFEHDLFVNAQLDTIALIDGLKISKPIISEISKIIFSVNEEIILYGDYFLPGSIEETEIYFNKNRAEVKNVYHDSIKVLVPLGNYSNREITEIKIKLYDSEQVFKTNCSLNNIWYMYSVKSDSEVFSGGGGVGALMNPTFVFENSAYFSVIEPNSGVLKNRLHKYTPETDTWEELPGFQIELGWFGNGGSTKLFSNNLGTVYIHIDRASDNFYSYDINTQKITKLSDLIIDNELVDPIGIFNNGDFYLGLGTAVIERNSGNSKIWKYDVLRDEWEFATEMPIIGSGAIRTPFVFEKNNKFYIGGIIEKAFDVWEFTPPNSWRRLADVIGNYGESIKTFQLEDKGFYIPTNNLKFWEYSINDGSLQQNTELSSVDYIIGNENIFSVGEFVYLVGYQKVYTPRYSGFSRYDHVILRTELSNFK